MTNQNEAILEENLMTQLESLKYERIQIKDEDGLKSNFKKQLEKHNGVSFSDNEFRRVLNHLNKGNVFEKAHTLRSKFALQCDDDSVKYIEFLDSDAWCKNLFQVTNQITMNGKYQCRYDVTILINGLPLVQIELKRRGIELKEAYNQINRYQWLSYYTGEALFQYVQLFVISNGVNTKYFSNNKKQTFEQTFFWADKENKNITNIEEFTNDFLEPCHISKMICRYIVLAEAKKILMVLRPYQYHAVESIINCVVTSNKNGYIWHTTGSGKTLTSFKTAQILTRLPQVHKVIFVVDRKDLDYQTTLEFNSFSDGSVDGTDNTKALVKQFGDDTPLIVTTIQKLNTAIHKERYQDKMKDLQNKRVVFIFDECHRSQFGDTHLRITKFFKQYQMLGFTGTPIFPENATGNALGKRTTEDLFHDCLHKYVITDAINDANVLCFSIEYIGKYTEKKNRAPNLDIEVEAIDTKELLEDDVRVGKIANYIINNHDRKTQSRKYTAMFCVSSVEMLTKYYDAFKGIDHNLKIATIFSYAANEEDKDANGNYDTDEADGAHIDERKANPYAREKLESYVEDYNKLFKCKMNVHDSKGFYTYYNDISGRVKHKEIDILLVVNMFLTGFDSPFLSTLYVDKNLKYHGLIQAFSRTNRLHDATKSQGNIVVFRNLKQATDEAIALFSNKDAGGVILMKPYEEYVAEVEEALEQLRLITQEYNDVSSLVGEEAKLEFIKAFRNVMRLKNILSSFVDFSFEDISIESQEFENYKGKYLDLYEDIKKLKQTTEKVSILDDIDFELELIHKDEINVDYILTLLKSQIAEEDNEEKKKLTIEKVSSTLANNPQLRSKKELIEEFINQHLEGIESENISEEFMNYWMQEKTKAFNDLCTEEELHPEKIEQIIENYLYDGRTPLKEDIAQSLKTKPKLLQRKKIIPRVTEKILDFVEKFIDGIGGGEMKYIKGNRVGGLDMIAAIEKGIYKT